MNRLCYVVASLLLKEILPKKTLKPHERTNIKINDPLFFFTMCASYITLLLPLHHHKWSQISYYILFGYVKWLLRCSASGTPYSVPAHTHTHTHSYNKVFTKQFSIRRRIWILLAHVVKVFTTKPTAFRPSHIYM